MGSRTGQGLGLGGGWDRDWVLSRTRLVGLTASDLGRE